MRLRYLLLAMSGVVVASSACSVDATAPLPFAAPESAGLSKGQVERPAGQGRGQGRPIDYTFRIDPRRDNNLQFGAHSLVVARPLGLRSGHVELWHGHLE